jgi:hypothetical protein
MLITRTGVEVGEALMGVSLGWQSAISEVAISEGRALLGK